MSSEKLPAEATPPGKPYIIRHYCGKYYITFLPLPPPPPPPPPPSPPPLLGGRKGKKKAKKAQKVVVSLNDFLSNKTPPANNWADATEDIDPSGEIVHQ